MKPLDIFSPTIPTTLGAQLLIDEALNIYDTVKIKLLILLTSSSVWRMVLTESMRNLQPTTEENNVDDLYKLLDYMADTYGLYLENDGDYEIGDTETEEEIYQIVLAKKQSLEGMKTTTEETPTMARVNVDNLVLCVDCTMVAVNGDYSGLDYSYDEQQAAERAAEIDAGLERLAELGNLCHSGQEPDEFSKRPCDCCGTRLAGSREYFHTLI